VVEKRSENEGVGRKPVVGSVKPDGRQRVSSVLTAEGQQGSTDEGDQGDDCTEAGCAVMISSSLVRKL